MALRDNDTAIPAGRGENSKQTVNFAMSPHLTTSRHPKMRCEQTNKVAVRKNFDRHETPPRSAHLRRTNRQHWLATWSCVMCGAHSLSSKTTQASTPLPAVAVRCFVMQPPLPPPGQRLPHQSATPADGPGAHPSGLPYTPSHPRSVLPCQNTHGAFSICGRSTHTFGDVDNGHVGHCQGPGLRADDHSQLRKSCPLPCAQHWPQHSCANGVHPQLTRTHTVHPRFHVGHGAIDSCCSQPVTIHQCTTCAHTHVRVFRGTQPVTIHQCTTCAHTHVRVFRGSMR